MGNYTRITEQERALIEMGLNNRWSVRRIAKRLERPPKTIAQEIKRNGGYLRYYWVRAHAERTTSNRAGYSKIEAIPGLACYIREKLKGKWSPEVIAGRWALDYPDEQTITHEAIYQWIYKQEDNLYLELPRKKRKRGRRPQRNKSAIPDRVSIHQRPEQINNRSEVGHYEGDLVFQQGNGSQNILTLTERVSRVVTFVKNDSKHSDVVIGSIKTVMEKSAHPIKSITLDNGTEFTKHSELGVKTYFCDAASPWQKGAVEHANGIYRRYIDYRKDAKEIDQDLLDSVADQINRKPRKILGFLTPYEMMDKLYNKNLEGVTLKI